MAHLTRLRPRSAAIMIALLAVVGGAIGFRVGIQSTTKVNNLEASGTVVAAGNTTIGGTGVSPNGGTARLSVITPDLGTEIGATPWSNKWTTFGNFGSLTSEGLGIGWSATNNEAVIASSAPSGAWKGLHTEAATYAFRVAGGASSGCTINSASSAACAGSLSVDGTAAVIRSGTGSPEGVVTAPVGSKFTRTNGSAGTTLYIKESGAGNTGWTAIASGTTFVAGDHITIAGSTISVSQIATARVLGRVSSSTGVVEDLTGTQATTVLDTVTASAKGLVPTLPNVATQYFSGVGTWTTPGGPVTQNVYELANTGATWNKPAGAKVVEVTVIGGGGGGGGGRQGVNGAERTGGGGGGGAHVAHAFFYGTDAPSSAVITVGAGGGGGTGATPANGSPGAPSDFGGRLIAYGGGGGQAGQTSNTGFGGGGGGGAGVGGVGDSSNNGGAPESTAAIGFGINGMSGGLSPAGFGEWGGGGGGRSNNAGNATGGGYSLYGGAGGGGGGRVTSANAAGASANGGSSGAIVGTIAGGRGAAGTANNNGGDGVVFGPYTGGGGGGGGAAATGNPGTGGKGYKGCGGGGGGAASTTANSPVGGNGGDGGDGRVIVTVYF